MTEPSDSSVSAAEKHIKKLGSLYTKHVIDLDEYTSSIFDRLRYLVSLGNLSPSDWSYYLDLIPNSVFPSFFDALQTKLELVDFMPSPGVVTVNNCSLEFVENLKRETRPVYVALYELARKKLEGGHI